MVGRQALTGWGVFFIQTFYLIIFVCVCSKTHFLKPVINVLHEFPVVFLHRSASRTVDGQKSSHGNQCLRLSENYNFPCVWLYCLHHHVTATRKRTYSITRFRQLFREKTKNVEFKKMISVKTLKINVANRIIAYVNRSLLSYSHTHWRYHRARGLWGPETLPSK